MSGRRRGGLLGVLVVTEEVFRRCESRTVLVDHALDEGAFDKGDIAETICDRITSGEYAKDELGEETVEAFADLITELSETLEKTE